MSFREMQRHFGFVLVLILGVSQGACDRFLRSSPSNGDQDALILKTDEVGCLKTVPSDIQLFLEDSPQAEVGLHRAFSCTQESLKAFMKYTRGSRENAYTSRDIQHFFNRYLLKENTISDGFQAQIMKVKMALVGGTEDVVTRVELDSFIELLGKLEAPLLTMKGKMDLVFFKSDPATVNKEKLTAASASMKSLSAFILSQTKITSSRYQWVDGVQFLRELNQFVGPADSLGFVLKWLPLAENVKVLFLGDNAHLVTQQEWTRAFDWAVDVFGIVMELCYQVRHLSFSQSASWDLLMDWLDQTLVAVQTSPQMIEKKILDSHSIDRLIDEVYRLQVFPTSVPSDLAKETYKKALLRLVDRPGSRLGTAADFAGLTQGHLQVLEKEYLVWKLSQTFLNQTYAKYKKVTTRNLRWLADRFEWQKQKFVTVADFPIKEELARSWKDFVGLLKNRNPVIYGTKGKLLMKPTGDKEAYPFGGATLMNSTRSYVRLAMMGYGDHQKVSLFENKISEQRFKDLEEDFREFGRQIRFLDPRQKDPATRTFKEGNFFAYDGNGDDWLSSTELFELLNLMISGGRTQVNEIYVDLDKERCLLNDRDVFNKPIVREGCFWRVFRQNIARYFDHLPGMAKFLAGLSDKEFNLFYANIMAVSRLDTHISGQIEYAEIRTITTALDYLESLMLVYDKNADGRLSEAELITAIPRFRAFIEKLSPLRTWLVEDIFLCMVYGGKKPGMADLAAFKFKRMTDLGDVGRLDLLKVMGVLKSSVVEPAR